MRFRVVGAAFSCCGGCAFVLHVNVIISHLFSVNVVLSFVARILLPNLTAIFDVVACGESRLSLNVCWLILLLRQELLP